MLNVATLMGASRSKGSFVLSKCAMSGSFMHLFECAMSASFMHLIKYDLHVPALPWMIILNGGVGFFFEVGNDRIEGYVLHGRE